MHHITQVEKLYKLWKEGEMFFIDVRTPQEYSLGHIPGAVNLDVTDVGFTLEVAKLDPSKKYVVYCKSGGRSMFASQKMQAMGLKIQNSIAGFATWKSAGFEIAI